MIIKEMTITECWCSKCSAGQVGKLHDIIMSENISMQNLIGRAIVCDNCGHRNVIEDVLMVIPTSFLISTSKEINKAKANDELKKWLDQ